jgi:hypothetical protein
MAEINNINFLNNDLYIEDIERLTEEDISFNKLKNTSILIA